MIEIDVGYRSGSGNRMTMTVFGELMNREDIPLGEPGMYCNNGGIECGGYNGGCPPYAPGFEKIKPSLPYFYVICVEFDMAWAYLYAGKPTPYFMLSYADRLTMFYIQRAVLYFEKEGYYALGASNCPGCSPKKCTVTRGGKCAKPKKRRFSMEATGIECQDIHREWFDEPLPWWYRTPDVIPAYMYRYAGIFSEFDVWLDEALLDFTLGDKSYIAGPGLSHGYEDMTGSMEIPEDKDDYGYIRTYRLEDLE